MHDNIITESRQLVLVPAIHMEVTSALSQINLNYPNLLRIDYKAIDEKYKEEGLYYSSI